MSRCIADCLNVGSNLVTIALVAGEVDELKRALALAPRSQRADWITRVSDSASLAMMTMFFLRVHFSANTLK